MRETLRITLLCEGDCCRRWFGGDALEGSYRRGGLGDPRTAWLRFAGDGERRLAAATGDRASLLRRPDGNMGLRLCRGGDVEEGGERLLRGGELLRLGDLEGRRLATGEARLMGELDSFLFGGGRGEGL